ncbi:MAG: hypothetical protein RLZZ579_228 [Actinomycetota bacterium]|jgi:hypothetical protein
MSELKFVTRDGDYLVFEAPDGLKHKVIIEENLRDALRRSHLVQTSDVSPADIQKLIRSGLTVEAVATQFSVPIESVEPFAIPILDELRFLLQSAQSVMISDGHHMVTFDELVQRTLPNAHWDIHKEDGKWIVSASSSGQTARWHYIPQTRTLDATDAISKSISRLEGTRPELIPSKPLIASVPEVVNTTAQPSPIAQHPASQVEVDKSPEAEVEIVESAGASVLDLVAQLRQRRSEESKPTSAKGRTALPSWDEIVSETNSEANPD